MSRDETVAFVRRASSTYFHPVGTCAIGAGTEAMVDAELRVRGVEGLRIADTSVMPTIPSANTNAPVVVIGEFASRLLVAGSSAAAFTPSVLQRSGHDTHSLIRRTLPGKRRVLCGVIG
jgi:choline dehydrogenase-like flavoprotein